MALINFNLLAPSILYTVGCFWIKPIMYIGFTVVLSLNSIEPPLLLASMREPAHWPLPDVMQRIQQAGKGVLVVLRQPEQNKQLAAKIARYQQQDSGQTQTIAKAGWDMRTFGVGAQILADLGVKKMRVIGTPTKRTGVSGFGLELVGYLED